MKNKLLVTTALVALVGATNAFAGEPTYKEYINGDTISEDSVGHDGKPIAVETDTRISFVGDDSTIKLAENVSFGNFVTLDGKTKIVSENGTKKLTLSGYLTQTASGSDLSEIDLKIQKGQVNGKEEGELVLGNDLTVGNAEFTDGTGIFLYKNTDSDEKVLNISEDKTVSFAGNNYVSGGTDTSLKINGGNVNVDGELSISQDVDFNSNITVNEDGKIVSSNQTSQLKISGGTVSLKNNSQIEVNKIDITGGVLNINNARVDANDGNGTVNVSDATVNMSNDFNRDIDNSASNLSGFNGVNLAEGAIVNMNKGLSLIETGEDVEHANITINNAKLNLSGDAIGVLNSDGQIIMTGDDAEINIATGTDLFIRKGIANTENQNNVASRKNVLAFLKSGLSDEGVEQLFPNTLTINGGTLNNSGTLHGNITGNNSGNLNFKTSSSKIDGDVEGVKLGFDTIHSLSNAISGTIGDLAEININSGTLSFDKDTGTVANLNIKENAGLNIGDRNVSATNVDFADNSTLAFTITDKDKYGKISADAINVSETGTNLNLTLNKAALDRDETKTFTVLDSSALTGAFANLSKNSRYTFIDNGDGTFDIKSIASASDIVKEIGGSTNNVGTAEAWDGIATGSVGSETVKAIANKLAQLSNSTNAGEQKAYVDALTALAPEASPSVQSTSTETANQVFGAVGTRLSGGSTGSQQGMSSGDNPFKQVSAWIQGLFNKSKLDDTSSAKGFDADTYGTAFGLEKQLDAKSKVGIGYAYSQTDIDGFMRKTDVDTHTAIAYGEYKPTAKTYVNAIATYGFADYSEKKNVAGSQVKADYDVDSFGLQTMAGYNFDIKNATLTPEAGLRYVNIKQKAYTDTAGQKVSSNSSDILTGIVGAKVSKELTLNNGVSFKPELRAAATYDLSNDDANSVVTLANGSSYTTQGKALKRFGMEFGAGVSADINDKVEMSVGYEGKFRSNYKDHSGLVNFKYKF